MKRKGLICASILIFALSINSRAQDSTQNKQEDSWRKYEVSVTGGLSMPSGSLKNWNDSMGAKTGFDVGGSGGYFINDRISVGGYFSYVQFPMEKYKLHYKFYDIGGYAKYAFTGDSKLEPYLKVKAGVEFAKFATWIGPNGTRLRELSYGAGLAMAIFAGAVYYTSDYGGVFVEAGYNFAKLKNNSVENGGVKYHLKDNINYLNIRAGLSVFFGPEQ